MIEHTLVLRSDAPADRIRVRVDGFSGMAVSGNRIYVGEDVAARILALQYRGRQIFESVGMIEKN